MQIAYIDGPRLRRSLLAACDYAQRQRGELNRINVFPVPDGDTGTNLALTLRAIADHVRPSRAHGVGAVAREAAQAAVLGARGNCGMMLSHFLLGFSDALGARARIDTGAFGQALASGVDALSSSLERPVEGTILTVMRDTARAAVDADMPDFVPLIGHLVERARDSLARTPDLLPVLRASGVVDAGAKGFVALLEGVHLFIRGHSPAAPESEEAPRGPAAAATVALEGDAVASPYRFCTEALVRGRALPSQAVVQAHLRHLGDSLIVIRTGQVLKVHVHTDEPERVFAYLRSVGSLVTHKAEDMRAQHAAMERAAGEGHVVLARRPVVVATDSAGDLPEEVVRAHGIQVTPLVLVEGDRTLRDGVDITAAEFHARLASDGDALPTTSQPRPADFLETWQRAAEDGEAVVAVLLGSSLSGTFGSAEAARRLFGSAPVYLVDSLGASLLQGLLTLKAAELAESGMPPDDIARALDRARGRSGLLFTVDTFDRLLASGRVGRGRALLGSMLHVKPILSVNAEGAVEPVGRAIGRRRVLERLVAEVERRVAVSGGAPRLGIVHVGCPEIVAPVHERLRARFGEVETLVAPVTPVLATHLGTGAWGVAWMTED